MHFSTPQRDFRPIRITFFRRFQSDIIPDFILYRYSGSTRLLLRSGSSPPDDSRRTGHFLFPTPRLSLQGNAAGKSEIPFLVQHTLCAVITCGYVCICMYICVCACRADRRENWLQLFIMASFDFRHNESAAAEAIPARVHYDVALGAGTNASLAEMRRASSNSRPEGSKPPTISI